jgi:hypothetical protein
MLVRVLLPILGKREGALLVLATARAGTKLNLVVEVPLHAVASFDVLAPGCCPIAWLWFRVPIVDPKHELKVRLLFFLHLC